MSMMAIDAHITRRFALLGAAAAAVGVALPVHAATETRDDPAKLFMLVKMVTEVFDGSSFGRQRQLIREIRAADPEFAELADVFERRSAEQWVWVPTDIPGLSVPSNA
jgi:hypothetical protein